MKLFEGNLRNQLKNIQYHLFFLTLQPNDEQACSTISKTYQYYWHSTNHSRSFDQQNVTSHQLSLEMSGTSNKRRLTKLNGSVSAIEVF
jgi:hypothetical protein